MIPGFYNWKIHEDISIKHLDSNKKHNLGNFSVMGKFQCHGLFVKTDVTLRRLALCAKHTMWIIFSVCERNVFFKARFLKKYFYNSRIGKSSLSFYNFRMELLTNIILVIIGKPIKNLVTWYAYLKMSKLGDIPHYNGTGYTLHKIILQSIIESWLNVFVDKMACC